MLIRSPGDDGLAFKRLERWETLCDSCRWRRKSSAAVPRRGRLCESDPRFLTQKPLCRVSERFIIGGSSIFIPVSFYQAIHLFVDAWKSTQTPHKSLSLRHKRNFRHKLSLTIRLPFEYGNEATRPQQLDTVINASADKLPSMNWFIVIGMLSNGTLYENLLRCCSRLLIISCFVLGFLSSRVFSYG